jgi:hypothetical protein
MLDELKYGRRLLDGFRDLPKSDDAELIEAIVTLSDFVTAHPNRLDSIDINPIRVIRGAAVVLDANIILR